MNVATTTATAIAVTVVGDVRVVAVVVVVVCNFVIDDDDDDDGNSVVVRPILQIVDLLYDTYAYIRTACIFGLLLLPSLLFSQ